VEKLPFNTRAFDELSPVPFQNGLVFVSNRRVSVLNTNTDAEKGTPVNNIWYTEQRDDGKWIAPRLLSDDLSSIVHEGPATFNPGDYRLFYTPARRQKKGQYDTGDFYCRQIR
jgi:hypothetical protein